MTGQKGKSGGQRPGAGRPVSFKARLGDLLIIEQSSISRSKFYKPELGTVCGINDNELEVQIGNEILVIRFPDPDELEISS